MIRSITHIHCTCTFSHPTWNTHTHTIRRIGGELRHLNWINSKQACDLGTAIDTPPKVCTNTSICISYVCINTAICTCDIIRSRHRYRYYPPLRFSPLCTWHVAHTNESYDMRNARQDTSHSRSVIRRYPIINKAYQDIPLSISHVKIPHYQTAMNRYPIINKSYQDIPWSISHVKISHCQSVISRTWQCWASFAGKHMICFRGM